jgi:hypothetical protein
MQQPIGGRDGPRFHQQGRLHEDVRVRDARALGAAGGAARVEQLGDVGRGDGHVGDGRRDGQRLEGAPLDVAREGAEPGRVIGVEEHHAGLGVVDVEGELGVGMERTERHRDAARKQDAEVPREPRRARRREDRHAPAFEGRRVFEQRTGDAGCSRDQLGVRRRPRLVDDGRGAHRRQRPQAQHERARRRHHTAELVFDLPLARRAAWAAASRAIGTRNGAHET